MQINRVSVNNYSYKTRIKNNSCLEKKRNYISHKSESAFKTPLLVLKDIYFVGHFNEQNIENLFNEAKSSNSIMKLLKNSKLNPLNFKKLMFKITADECLSEKFILEMINNPKNSKENIRILNEKIGGDKQLFEWMFAPTGYQEAYSKYIVKLYEKSTSPDELIKYSPNWNVWKFKEKFGSDFTIGKLPKAFGEIDDYRNIFHKALVTDKHKSIQGIKFGEYIGGGLSGKAVRKLEADGKKYILKFQGSDLSHSNEDLKDIASMHSDSTFLNAQLDRYLHLNGYQQNAKLIFFDYKTNSALYEMSEGDIPQNIDNIIDVNKQLGDLNKYGVYYNDINTGNFLINNGKISFIDSGESSFADFFKPGISGFHFELPNLNGESIINTAAAMQLSKI